MKYVELSPNGAARTTVNSKILSDMGYNKEWVEANKIVLSENEKPILADGRRLNAYGIPAIKMIIAGHEILHNGYFIRILC